MTPGCLRITVDTTEPHDLKTFPALLVRHPTRHLPICPRLSSLQQANFRFDTITLTPSTSVGSPFERFRFPLFLFSVRP